MSRFSLAIIATVGVLVLSSCATFWGDSKPPEITQDMDVDDLIEAAIEFGGPTMVSVGRTLRKKNELAKAGDLLANMIVSDDGLNGSKLVNAVRLFKVTQHKRSPEVFSFLVSSGGKVERMLGWQVAAALASPEMGARIDEHLSHFIAQGSLEDHFVPELAHALSNNRLTQNYSVARHALFATNQPEFARAMSLLGAAKASNDLLTYLAQANVEEIRQLNMSTIDVLAAIQVLEHLGAYPVDISHPNFEHILFCAISRNTVLSALARKVIDSYLPDHRTYLAMLIAKQARWVQLAFIESSRRRLTPVLSLLLNEVVQYSGYTDVEREVGNIHL